MKHGVRLARFWKPAGEYDNCNDRDLQPGCQGRGYSLMFIFVLHGDLPPQCHVMCHVVKAKEDTKFYRQEKFHAVSRIIYILQINFKPI